MQYSRFSLFEYKVIPQTAENFHPNAKHNEVPILKCKQSATRLVDIFFLRFSAGVWLDSAL